MRTLLSIPVILLMLVAFSSAIAQDTQTQDTTFERKKIDLEGSNFLDYYDDLYTEGFTWLIEDELFVGKEEWNEGFQRYVLYIDKNEEPTLVDSTLDRGGNQLRIIEVARGDRPSYYILRAWRMQEKGEKIELEILLTKEAYSDSLTNEIDKMRQKWEKLSNLHDPAALLNLVYAPDSYYVNGGKVVQGWEPITERYGYMKRPNWQISLTAQKVVQVSSDMAIEIGEYRSTGPGKYVLLWKKYPDYGWRVMLDFNF